MEYPPREFMSSAVAPSAVAPRDTASRDSVEPVPKRRSVRNRGYPVQFKFDKKHGCTKVKVIYYRMIRKF